MLRLVSLKGCFAALKTNFIAGDRVVDERDGASLRTAAIVAPKESREGETTAKVADSEERTIGNLRGVKDDGVVPLGDAQMSSGSEVKYIVVRPRKSTSSGEIYLA